MTYEIEQTGDAVRLTLTQANDRQIDDDILSGGRAGWPAIRMEPPRRMRDALRKLGIKTP